MTELLPEKFKEMFPLFKSVDDTRVIFWITLFASTYSEKAFAQLWEQGCYLYVAHNLFLELKTERLLNNNTENPTEAIVAGGDSVSSGVLTSEYMATGPVIHSKSYTNKNTVLSGIGEWGQTVYGQRFYQILQIVGIQVLYVPSPY